MRKVCIVLVDVRSAHNVGSIMRTADGFSAEVILVGITPRPSGFSNDDRLPHVAQKAHKSIAKTALGAEQSVQWRYFTDAELAFNTLKSEGFIIAAIEQNSNAKNIQTLQPTENYALVVGPEVDGLEQRVTDFCDEIYEIPMSGTKESFNVSIAASIALYQLSRKPLPQ